MRTRGQKYRCVCTYVDKKIPKGDSEIKRNRDTSKDAKMYVVVIN